MSEILRRPNGATSNELIHALGDVEGGALANRPVVVRMWVPGGSEAVALLTRVEVASNGTLNLVADRMPS